MLKTVYFDIMVLAGIGIDRHEKKAGQLQKLCDANYSSLDH